MYSRNWRIAMMVPWLALIAIVVDIAMAYNRLPSVIASHFNAAGVPNGWAPKDQVFLTIFAVAFGLLCLFTFILSRFPQISGLGWLLMIAEYWAIGLLSGITHGTLRVGVDKAQTLDFPIGTWTAIMAGALVVGEIGRIGNLRKRADQDHGQLIAEERHGSTIGVALALIALSIIGSSSLMPPAARVPIVIAGLLVMGCAFWAVLGFVYRITTAGLEIRTMGLPLRFIAAGDVDSYRAEDCNPLTDFGGWGIRGIGKTRAYIWGGNRCVHVHTRGCEEIYLGVSDADRMVRELESMAPKVHR